MKAPVNNIQKNLEGEEIVDKSIFVSGDSNRSSSYGMHSPGYLSEMY